MTCVIQTLSGRINDSQVHYCVATIGEKVVGHASLTFHDEQGHYHLGDAYVAEEYRRMGVHTALTHARVTIAGSRPVTAVVKRNNIASLLSLEKSGFVATWIEKEDVYMVRPGTDGVISLVAKASENQKND